jgi:hypothetical protein
VRPLQRPLEGGPENRDFFDPEMSTGETHVHKITRYGYGHITNNVPVVYMALELNGFDGGKSITRAIGRGGWALKNLDFFGP